MTRQTDWDDDDEYEDGVCDHCGRTKRVITTNDPYAAGINDEITEDSKWCYDCYQNCLDEI